MRIARRTLPALVAVLVAVAGCGGGSSGPDADAVLKETFGPGHPIDSGRLSLALRLSGEGGGVTPLDVTVTGPFNAANKKTLPRFAFEVSTGSGTDAAAGIISTGRRGYVTAGGQAFVLTDAGYRRLRSEYEQTQRASDARAKRSGGFAALGLSPLDWVAGDATVADADVGGTPTRRVSGELDVAALLSDADTLLGRSSAVGGRTTASVPKGIDAATRAAIERSVKTAKVTVDAGRDDGTLRQITLRLILAVADADRKTLGGLRALDLDLQMTLTDLGKVTTIAAPRDARPVSELTGALKQLGAASGAGGAATTPESAATPSGSDAQARYSRCLAAAGDDVEAIQRCAPILGR